MFTLEYKLWVVKSVIFSFQLWLIFFFRSSLIPRVSFHLFLQQKAQMVLRCCHVTFRLPKLVCHGLLPFELNLALNSYLICLICSPFPACPAHFPISIFYFIEVITLASIFARHHSAHLQVSVDYYCLCDAFIDFLSKT